MQSNQRDWPHKTKAEELMYEDSENESLPLWAYSSSQSEVHVLALHHGSSLMGR